MVGPVLLALPAAAAAAAPCNVSGLWTWDTFSNPNTFVVTSTTPQRCLFTLTTSNPTPWRTARGAVYANRTAWVHYGCSGDACFETGCIDTNCSKIQLGNGAFIRGSARPPPPPRPADFAGEVAFLATLSLDYLGGSRFWAKKPAPVGPPRCDDSASAATASGGDAPNALFSPNVQPGGELSPRPLPPSAVAD